MNYLGHAYLSFGDGAILTGNMIGDHVKGKLALGGYEEGVRKGIELHRKIDEHADRHPATLRAKLLFREDFGLYSGAIMDTLYDHFLANDPQYFATPEELKAYTIHIYKLLDEHTDQFPPTFAAYYPYMKEQNWLYNYRSIKGIEKSLHGLARRAQYMPPIEKAYDIFVAGYYQLNQCYYEFIDDMIKFAKGELR
jgi:acyl carrier protein phosphodiesterase